VASSLQTITRTHVDDDDGESDGDDGEGDENFVEAFVSDAGDSRETDDGGSEPYRRRDARGWERWTEQENSQRE